MMLFFAYNPSVIFLKNKIKKMKVNNFICKSSMEPKTIKIQ